MLYSDLNDLHPVLHITAPLYCSSGLWRCIVSVEAMHNEYILTGRESAYFHLSVQACLHLQHIHENTCI